MLAVRGWSRRRVTTLQGHQTRYSSRRPPRINSRDRSPPRLEPRNLFKSPRSTIAPTPPGVRTRSQRLSSVLNRHRGALAIYVVSIITYWAYWGITFAYHCENTEITDSSRFGGPPSRNLAYREHVAKQSAHIWDEDQKKRIEGLGFFHSTEVPEDDPRSMKARAVFAHLLAAVGLGNEKRTLFVLGETGMPRGMFDEHGPGLTR